MVPKTTSNKRQNTPLSEWQNLSDPPVVVRDHGTNSVKSLQSAMMHPSSATESDALRRPRLALGGYRQWMERDSGLSWLKRPIRPTVGIGARATRLLSHSYQLADSLR